MEREVEITDLTEIPFSLFERLRRLQMACIADFDGKNLLYASGKIHPLNCPDQFYLSHVCINGQWWEIVSQKPITSISKAIMIIQNGPVINTPEIVIKITSPISPEKIQKKGAIARPLQRTTLFFPFHIIGNLPEQSDSTLTVNDGKKELLICQTDNLDILIPLDEAKKDKNKKISNIIRQKIVTREGANTLELAHIICLRNGNG